MTVYWNSLTPEEKQALERLFTHYTFPMLSVTADRLIDLGLAERKLDGIGLSRAGEELVMQQGSRK